MLRRFCCVYGRNIALSAPGQNRQQKIECNFLNSLWLQFPFCRGWMRIFAIIDFSFFLLLAHVQQ